MKASSKILLFLAIALILGGTLTAFLLPGRECSHSNLTEIAGKAPSCTEVGNEKYYYCEDCYGAFLDATCMTGITVAQTVIPPIEHTWQAASCGSPKTCTACAETEGDALGHDWLSPDCTTAAVCRRCNETSGDPIGHDWMSATCESPKTCATCAETEGETLGHDWQSASCTAPKTCRRCQGTEGDSLGHNWQNATCESPATCSRCSQAQGEKLGHNWQNATCESPAICSRCSVPNGDSLGHDWQGASCTVPKTCRRCQGTEGDALGHNWQNATCESPMTCSRCLLADGSPLAHDYDPGSAAWDWTVYADTATCRLVLTCKNDPSHKTEVEAEVLRTVVTPPTCMETGEVAYSASAIYDQHTYTDSRTGIVLDPVAHVFDLGAGVFTWSSDYSQAFFHVPCSLAGGHVEQFLTRVEQSVDPATCETDGAVTFTAVTTVSDHEYTDVKTVPISAHGHAYVLANTEWSQGAADLVGVRFTFVCENDTTHTVEKLEFATCDTRKEPGCILPGTMVCTASVTFGGETYERSTTLEIAAPGKHEFVGGLCLGCAKPEHSGGLAYEKTQDGLGYAVVGIGSFTGDVLSIPDFYLGLPVTEIADRAFYHDSNITAVYLPDCLVSIGANAFVSCDHLKTLDLGGSVRRIGQYAFAYCSALEAVLIPDSTELIDEYAFSGCQAVRALTLGANVKTICAGAFLGMRFCRELVLPAELDSIGNYAFSDWHSITRVVLPASLTYLSSTAFEGCERLIEIQNLSSLPISAGGLDYLFVKHVYTDPDGESRLHHDESGCVFYVDGDTVYLVDFIGNGPVVLPESYEGRSYGIYNYAFFGTELGDGVLHLPAAVSSIGRYAFFSNETLRVITGAEGVGYIGAGAFQDCRELLSITLGSSLTAVHDYAFEGCIRLIDVINHSSLNVEAGKLGYYKVALYALKVHTAASATTHITVTGDGYAWYTDTQEGVYLLVRYFGDAQVLKLPEKYLAYSYDIYSYAFDEKNSVTKIEISPGTAILHKNAFLNCEALRTFSFYGEYESLSEIREGALWGTSITFIELPGSLTFIGKMAFPSTLEVAKISDTEGWRRVMGFSSGSIGTKVPDRFYSDTAAYIREYEDYDFFKKTT